MQKKDKSHLIKLLVCVFAIQLASCDNSSIDKNQTLETINITDASKSLNNKGVGEMGSFNYTKATESFEKLITQNPNWELAQQNLAIALLNRQKPGDEERAMKIAESLSKTNDGNLIAHYIVGILKFNQGLCEQALPRFNAITASDKSDAYALYFAGQCHLQNGAIEQSLSLYQQAIKADVYLRSAYYGGFMAAQRLQKGDLAEEMLEAYQKLDSNPKAKLAEIKYTRMGPKANAQAYKSNGIKNQSINKSNKLSAPYFLTPKALKVEVNEIQNFGLVNLNQTERPQLYVIDSNQLKIYTDFSQSTQEPPQFITQLNEGQHQIAWGDINNDNKVDFYVTGITDQLFLQSDTGFKEIDMQSFGFSALTSIAVRLADTDHDGDLDLLVLDQSGRFEIWNNNLNNTFTALSEKTTLPSKKGYKSIFIQDLDSDRDADIILLSDHQLTVLLNDRMWDYQTIDSAIMEKKINSLSLTDNDINGLPEINALMDNNSIVIFEWDDNILSKTGSIVNLAATSHLSLDSNGNGRQEHLIVDSDALRLLDATGMKIEKINIKNTTAVKVLNTVKGPELLLLANHQLYHVAANDNRLPFVLLNFSGKEDKANSVRSNFSGIGTRVVLHSQDFYAIGDSFHNLTGTDQDYQSQNLAAGSQQNIDFIGLDWSDGVYQTELALHTNQFHKITETQRQLSSCPVIFAWNNGKYEFISDVLGVGGIGFAVGRHQYGQPRPWENYLLKSDQLSSENGVFKIQFTEPMEESAYLDEMQIQVIDIPKKWSLILDERMQISLPIVTGDALYYQSLINPIQVLNKNNKDVTEQALTTDKKAIEIINHDHRFLGLVDEQIITLEFKNELSGDYQFILNGWVEYGYSQTMFAAWQADLIAQAPTLEYKANGQWETLLTEFGYPAGMPRQASVPITIPESTRFIRIRTNMEIYFDQLALVKKGQPDSIEKYSLTLKSATLKQLGFPKREDNAQRVPHYDFNNIQPFWDTRYMQGAYTQLGIITELVAKQDNALAIIAAGEGIELQFIDDLPLLKDGFDRYYILKFKGWAKDMDILTKDGETLKPIPASGLINKNAQKLNEKYNNRFKAGK